MSIRGPTIPIIPDLRANLWDLIAQIPVGRVTTYGDLARSLGDIAASRFVGQVLVDHDHAADCRCYRVVRSNGTLGHFISSGAEKGRLLAAEGIPTRNGRLDLSVWRWCQFQAQATPPLVALAEHQRQAATWVVTSAELRTVPRRIGGVDVSFAPGQGSAVAAFSEVDLRSGELVDCWTYTQTVTFPYIPGYLSYRELPVLLALLERVRQRGRLPEVVLVDGSGTLHPRRAGLATLLGVYGAVTTIGVTKKHLVGDVDLRDLSLHAFRPIEVDGVLAGFAMLPGSGTAKPMYVSPGHGIDARGALEVARRCRRSRRLLEPIYWADRCSRAAARRVAVGLPAEQPI